MTKTTYPEHEKMRKRKAALDIPGITRILENLTECRIPFEIVKDNRPLIERMDDTLPGALRDGTLGRFERFVEWVEDNVVDETLCGRPFERDEPLMPSEWLFAAYLDIDVARIEDEKRAMLEEMRG